MRITVIVKPNAKEEKVEKMDADHYRVYVKAAPEEGAANRAVIETLSRYFETDTDHIVILSGQKSKKKLVAIKTR
ncbi:MAG: DUF167 domain-containing protein [Candidatus Omnitrophica bacterium]|nr:DUF167 domain-containing protein [Candidatus Omnitrophota bacterium]